MDSAVAELLKVLRARGRDDLVERAVAAGARLKRPSTIVCVVGEFKQGKSSLINGLLGQSVCPVDDDLATSAITLVRHGEQLGAVVRRRQGDESVAEPVPVDALGDWVSEAGNPGNLKHVERVDISSPSPMLRQGLVLVDTPGMGGLGAGHAAATLAFLPFADGLILVSDAGAELSAPEMDLLQHATELCPTVMFVQTKIDLYPAWQRVFELNHGHLESRGIPIPMAAVSSTLRQEALARQDRPLNDASRFPELIDALTQRVIGPAKESAAVRSADDIRAITSLVRAGLDEERRLLADPSQLRKSIDELNAANEELKHLRGPGARWSVTLGDRISDLSNNTMHEFRAAMRETTKVMDERIEELRTGEQWSEAVRDLQGRVAEDVANAFVTIERGRLDTYDEIAALLRDDQAALPAGLAERIDPIDLSRIWRGKPIEEAGSRGRRAFGTALTGVRGAQGGMIMLSMLGGKIFGPPTTMMGALIASNPILFSVGGLLAGHALLEDRKRKVAQRRAAARQQVRQFADDVQFEVTNAITSLVRDIQRDLRDAFSERLAELQQTYAETARHAQENAKKSHEDQKRRAAEVEAALAQLAHVESLVGVTDG